MSPTQTKSFTPFKSDNFYNTTSITVAILLITVVTCLLIALSGCTGKEVFPPDTTIPNRPVLIPHLGDTGDSIFINGARLDDTNNGIDTVPEGNWLRIQWYRIDDALLDYMKIYRFGEYSEVAVIDSLSRSQIQRNEHLDNRLHTLNPVGQKWSYFTEVFLTNGRSSISDTVSYKLIEKPFLLTPNNYERVTPDSLKFHWMQTQDALHYRVLVFDAEYQYIWHQDYYIIEDSDFILPYTGPDLSSYIGDLIIWRVDAFGDIDNEEGISISGSESQERYIELIP